MAERVLKLVNGIARMTDISTGAVSVKDEGGLVEANVTELDFTGAAVQVSALGGGAVQVDHAAAGGGVAIYDETTELVSDISSGTAITLPSAKQYNSEELEIYLNNVRQNDGENFEYVGVVPRTQIEFNEDLVTGDRIRFRIDRDFDTTPTIFDESLVVVASGAGAGEINGPITTGTPITLPAAQTYEDDELEIYLNNVRIDSTYDYNHEGTVPRTQISFTFDIIVGDVIRFRVDRVA